jgi:SAM-dependent methyltransferase
MRILEVGAGTGGATVPILDVLMRHGNAEFGTPRFEQYDFTDISSSFFEAAREKYKSSKDRMRFLPLDIEKDPLQQGYEAGHYDLIIASNVGGNP